MSSQLPVRQVGEVERKAALELLRSRLGGDDMSLEEFSDAASAVVNARTTADLARVLAASAPSVRFTPSDRRLYEPLVIDVQSGKMEFTAGWQLARETSVSCQSGRIKLDLTHAEFDGTEIELDLFCQSGKIEVIVPWPVDLQFVRVSGRSGRVENRLTAGPALPAIVHLRVSAETASGRIVFRRPGDEPTPRRRGFRRRLT